MSKNTYSYVFKVFFNATLKFFSTQPFCTFCCLVYVAYTINITGINTYIQIKTNTEINKEIYMYIYIICYKIKTSQEYFFCEYDR